MIAKFTTGDSVIALARTARTEPGDELRVVRVLRETRNGSLIGFSYSVVNLDAGITVPFKIFERDLI